MPGSTKGRSKTNPIPGSNTQFEALRNYMLENTKAKYNLMMALSSWRTIEHFESTNAMGKQTKHWGWFMRMKANASLCYPTEKTEKWVNDPNFKIKKTKSVTLKIGDCVYVPAKKLHSHGSTNKKADFSHIAINSFPKNNVEPKTIWYESDFKSYVTKRLK